MIVRRIASGVMALALTFGFAPQARADYVHDIGRAEARTHQPQWALETTNVREAWRTSKGERVTVGVVDSGVGPTWELDRRVAKAVDFAGHLTPRVDRMDHGTAVACIIAARPPRPGWRGITGVAPAARLYSARTFWRDFASRKVVIRGIRWATRQQVDVLNVSFAMKDSPDLRRAVRIALRAGVIVVAGAGNSGGARAQHPAYPAAYPKVIAVGGVAADLSAYSLTTRGSYVDVAAPAEDVLSCDPFDTLSHYSGTSYAAPMVSGVVALMKAVSPDLDAAAAERILEETAQDLGDPGWDDTYGWGLVDAAAAVRAARH